MSLFVRPREARARATSLSRVSGINILQQHLEEKKETVLANTELNH